MLVLLPPSEEKSPPPGSGPPVDLDSLSFPGLTATRSAVLAALVETSARPDAGERLLVGPRLARDVERNTRLLEVPARPALDVYRGVLHTALDAASLSPGAAARAASWLVVVSSLWGAVRPADRIPAYRLDVCARLVGLPPLEPLWRPLLGPVLDEAAGSEGVVVDLRSSGYAAVGTPLRAADRTAVVRVRRDDGARIDGHTGKRVRGEVARTLLERGHDPADPLELAEALTGDWSVRALAPQRRGRPWILDVVV